MADQQLTHYQRTMTMDLSAERVFAFVSQLGNLPRYLPPITSAEATGPEAIRLRGEIPGHGKIEGDGYFKVDQGARRMEWGARFERDYKGALTVADAGRGRAEVTVELWFGPHTVAPQIEREADRGGGGGVDEGIDRTLESIRRQVEGEGGKLPPDAPSAGAEEQRG